MASLAHRGLVHLGMDVSKDSISVAILHPDRDVAVVDKISSDEESVRRLVKRTGRPSGIWACYEAGPTGIRLVPPAQPRWGCAAMWWRRL